MGHSMSEVPKNSDPPWNSFKLGMWVALHEWFNHNNLYNLNLYGLMVTVSGIWDFFQFFALPVATKSAITCVVKALVQNKLHHLVVYETGFHVIFFKN